MNLILNLFSRSGGGGDGRPLFLLFQATSDATKPSNRAVHYVHSSSEVLAAQRDLFVLYEPATESEPSKGQQQTQDMETSIFNKLSREVREQVYNSGVFDGAAIRIFVESPPYYHDEAKVSYSFSKCGLAATCHAIKDESLVAMWRNAVCEAASDRGELWLHHLRRLLPHQYAQHIAHLRDVCIPSLEQTTCWCLEMLGETLRGFPCLRTCTFQLADYSMVADYQLAIEIGGTLRSIGGWNVRNDAVELDRRLLCFGSKTGLSPQVFLHDRTGVRADCGIQMVMKVDLAGFPIQCFIPSIRETTVKAKAILPAVRSVLETTQVPSVVTYRYQTLT